MIDAYWSGFVDLRSHPKRISELSESRELPGLADTLSKLNAAESPVWTSKTDVFTPERVDPDEMGASREEAVFAVACYIDLLLRKDQWTDPSKAERKCRQICARLRGIDLRRCRVDIVVRRTLAADPNDLGATAYVTACGPSLVNAKARLAECLDAFTEVIVTR